MLPVVIDEGVSAEKRVHSPGGVAQVKGRLAPWSNDGVITTPLLRDIKPETRLGPVSDRAQSWLTATQNAGGACRDFTQSFRAYEGRRLIQPIPLTVSRSTPSSSIVLDTNRSGKHRRRLFPDT